MGFNFRELLVVLIVVMLVFGTKKIRNLGSDAGGWIRDFKKALKDGNEAEGSLEANAEHEPAKHVIEGEATPVNEKKNA
ncbi:MAG: twin-arginine translocase TatA/TatE family subunit [Gammaproteobacteria bacterium]|nr:twin-arginine translocase TatA/TatE family subunit [Gammaproteobacteria bacterium]MBI5617175.1 twin-arginine translocase TatA/TatE family subunit [Gammaproteobacteria bacterium]